MSILLAMLVCAALGFAQGSTTAMDGTVKDPQGATIADAQVEVTLVATGAVFKTTTDARGHWVIPAMGAGVYRVVVSKQGFSTKTTEGVTVNAGVPATVNVDLQLGQVTQTVEVSAGTEIVQTTSAAVSSTVPSRAIYELPFVSRNAVELLVSQPGVSTPTNPRSSTINGLPRGALNVTIDGMNTQDNYNKSGDAFFSYIYASVDAIEEITLTTSAAGVDATGQGAAQTKFVTKSGSNSYHGGVFETNRNTWFNANTFFNNQALDTTKTPWTSQPRAIVKLNQFGGHVGGPIVKDKVFFFVNQEIFRLPSSQPFTRTILNQPAINGDYTYKDSAGNIKTVNVFTLAGAAAPPAGQRAFATTPDPILQNTFKQILTLSQAGGILSSRIVSNSDYNRSKLDYMDSAIQKRAYTTAKLDYNITQKHQLSFVYNYDGYNSMPDFLNSVARVYPGTGIILGTDKVDGQRSTRFMGVLSLRSALTARLTNEFRAGVNGGTVLFRDSVASASLFSQWKGYVPSFSYGSAVASTTNSSRRNAPVRNVSDTVSLVKGSHQLSFGGSFDQINLFQLSANRNVMPSISFGIAANDPVYSGTTSAFTTTSMPLASSTQLGEAANLYADLTGRVSGITRTLSLDENTKKYANVPVIDRARMREFGFFAQDVWRIRPSLTLTAGLRYERQLPFVNTNKTYSRVGLDGIWGVSGVGNLFRPGYMPGKEPTFQSLDALPDAYKIPAVWAPSLGLAWQLPAKEGVLGFLLGHHQGASVLRMGYSISTIREGSGIFPSIWGSNKGLNYDAALTPSTFPLDFGLPGSVLFRDSSYPARSGLPAAPAYPMAVLPGDGVNEFDPNLKLGYVQSWNIGFQRELSPKMVMEIRYSGNHGLHEWRQYDNNEVNVVENGFLKEFLAAQNNLTIARNTQGLTSNNYGNQGLPGQVDIPVIKTSWLATGSTTDTTFAGYLLYANSTVTNGTVGTAARSIARDSTRMGRLTAAGYAANWFVANPAAATGGAYIVSNGGSSFYDALQVELRRRMGAGLMLDGSYAWAKSLNNGAMNSASSYSQPTTQRNWSLNKGMSNYDIRHAIKMNPIYELPIGPGRRFLSGGNPVIKKVLEGWELAGVIRVQSSVPLSLFGGGSDTFDSSSQGAIGTGVILHNITVQEIQDMIKIRKATGSDFKGIVYYLPQDFIDNTKSAFNAGGNFIPKNVDTTKPYVSPAGAGQMGWMGSAFRGPWLQFYDVAVMKKTKIRERMDFEFRAQMLNVLNRTNFNGFSTGGGTAFGQVTGAYNDLNGSFNPGGRIIELLARFNF